MKYPSIRKWVNDKIWKEKGKQYWLRCLSSIKPEKHWKRWVYIYLYIKRTTNQLLPVAPCPAAGTQSRPKKWPKKPEVFSSWFWIIEDLEERTWLQQWIDLESQLWFWTDMIGTATTKDEDNEGDQLGVHCGDVESKTSEIVRRGWLEEFPSKRRDLNSRHD